MFYTLNFVHISGSNMNINFICILVTNGLPAQFSIGEPHFGVS